MKESDGNLISTVGKNAHLAILSADGKVLRYNDQLTNIGEVAQVVYKGQRRISVMSSQRYTNPGYFKLADKIKADLLELKPVEVESASDETEPNSASYPEKVIAEFLSDPSSNTSFTLAELMNRKNLYQTFIVDPYSNDLSPEKTYPSNRRPKSPVVVFDDNGSQVSIDSLALKGLEYRQSNIIPY